MVCFFVQRLYGLQQNEILQEQDKTQAKDKEEALREEEGLWSSESDNLQRLSWVSVTCTSALWHTLIHFSLLLKSSTSHCLVFPASRRLLLLSSTNENNTSHLLETSFVLQNVTLPAGLDGRAAPSVLQLWLDDVSVICWHGLWSRPSSSPQICNKSWALTR